MGQLKTSVRKQKRACKLKGVPSLGSLKIRHTAELIDRSAKGCGARCAFEVYIYMTSILHGVDLVFVLNELYCE